MTYALRVVIILLAISIIAGAVTGSSLYYRFSYLWGFLLIGSWLMSFMTLRGIEVKRSARTYRSQVGQIFEERFEVTNTGRVPRLWIEVRDESTLPGLQGSHVLTMVGGKESYSYLSRARLAMRGVFPLGPTVLVSGDLFGIFPVSKSISNTNSLLVYPMMVDVHSFPNPPGLLPGGEALRRRTQQITSNAAGIREYAPGDPLNRIHWVSTARRDRLMVKEFELDPLAEVWVFVDAARFVHASIEQILKEYTPQDVWRTSFVVELPGSTIEYAVTISASLARYYLRQRRAVGLVSAGPSLRILPTDRGGRQLNKILESLALVKAEGNLPLHSLVEAQARHLPRGSTTVLVTPNSSEDVYKTADLLLRRGLRPIVVLIDTATFGKPTNLDKIEKSLRTLGVPYCLVKHGDNLTAVLSDTTRLPLWG